jgi:tetratricopeptide (TPR) repeat protein
VIVTGDHGEGLGDHGEMTHGTFAYESTLRVPLIVAQLRLPASGSRLPASNDVPVQHVDIFPTIAALVGLDVPAGLPGRSLLTADETPRTSYFEAMSPMLTRGWAPLRGVINGRDKYIDLPVEELYDLSTDPREERNLATGAHQRLSASVEKLRALNALLPGEQSEEQRDVRARLQSLGYVSGAAARKASYTTADDPKQLIELDRLMLQGLEFQQQRRTADAVAAFRSIISRRPDMVIAYRRLAIAQWDAGLAADAIATLGESMSRNGRDVETEVRLGTYLAESGRASEAIGMLEKASVADAQNSEALNALGIAYARAGRPADAMATFERALKVDPRDVYAYENIGTIYLQRNDLQAARASFSRALEQDPRSSRAHAGLGVVARQEDRIDDAIAEWKRAVDLDRSNYDALFNLARELAASGRHADARPYVMQFVQTAPPAVYARDIEQFRRYLSGTR